MRHTMVFAQRGVVYDRIFIELQANLIITSAKTATSKPAEN